MGLFLVSSIMLYWLIYNVILVDLICGHMLCILCVVCLSVLHIIVCGYSKKLFFGDN